MNTSLNFSKTELSCKCCGVNACEPVFVEALQELRDEINRPLILTSAYRCEKYNQEIGGSERSQHILGLAADIKCENSYQRYEIVSKALELGFSGIGIHKDFIHVDLRMEDPVLFLY